MELLGLTPDLGSGERKSFRFREFNILHTLSSGGTVLGGRMEAMVSMN